MGRRSVISEQILEVMSGGGRHCWTLEDLHDDLAGRGVEPDPSSVFRAVTRLEDAGRLVRVPVDDRRGRFEVAGAHHEHLVCEVCGAIEPIACSIVASLTEQVQAACGFVVSGHQLVLSGSCRHCANGPGPHRRERAR